MDASNDGPWSPGGERPRRVTAVRVAETADGMRVYAVDLLPGELPGVSRRDLQSAWETAREAAQRAAWSQARAFRFRRSDGSWTDLALRDPDAQCWAGAVDRMVGLETGYGISVCLRLLALVDLLSHAAWTARLLHVDGRHTALHPVLLRLAAEAALTDDARFDEPALLARMQAAPGSPLKPGAARR